MYTLKLDKPLEYGNTKIEELIFDFSKLTGQDMLDAEKEAENIDGAVAVEFSGGFLTALAAKAAGVQPIILKDLPADKFLLAKIQARRFIMGTVMGEVKGKVLQKE